MLVAFAGAQPPEERGSHPPAPPGERAALPRWWAMLSAGVTLAGGMAMLIWQTVVTGSGDPVLTGAALLLVAGGTSGVVSEILRRVR